jgi:hypothetical protein
MANITRVLINGKEVSKILINGGVWFRSTPQIDMYQEYSMRIEDLGVSIVAFQKDVIYNARGLYYHPAERLPEYKWQSDTLRIEITSETSLTTEQKEDLYAVLDSINSIISELDNTIKEKEAWITDLYNDYDAKVNEAWRYVYVPGDEQSLEFQNAARAAREAYNALEPNFYLYNVYVSPETTLDSFPFESLGF